MGLDMYLYKKTWVNNSDFYEAEHRAKIMMTKGGIEYDTSKIRYIVEEIGYWRKANAIHRWFVYNVQGGNDDCVEYRVTLEKLDELNSLCKAVLKEIETGETQLAEAELPTQSGFFFGDTSYDEWYKNDLKNTIAILDRLTEDDKWCTITYSSSW
jgi:hypothetical protein